MNVRRPRRIPARIDRQEPYLPFRVRNLIAAQKFLTRRGYRAGAASRIIGSLIGVKTERVRVQDIDDGPRNRSDTTVASDDTVTVNTSGILPGQSYRSDPPADRSH